ncbi:MAG: class II fructose-bisphosphatase [Candidatus Melainabacteria bacterium]|nr:class II fructose-bisphosphatase [Candidatus Melainabacteria bacterium]
MERALSREVLGVVEQAALAAGRFMGRGERDQADLAAVQAMRQALGQIPINGTIVIGEGERDEAPMLYIGEHVGTGVDQVNLPAMDIAVDPLEGTNLVANGLPGAVATLAISTQGGLFHAPDTYMDKLVVGPSARGKVDINAPVKYNLHMVAMCLERQIEDLTVVILDRPRHQTLIQEVRDTGARIRLVTDGDMMPAISAALEGTGVHAVMGIGGAPEAVLSAAAIKCLGGEIQARLCWRHAEEKQRAAAMGIDLSESKVYFTQDLAPGNDIVFAACGITHGDILQGVRYFGTGSRTHSLLLTHQAGLIRFVDSVHVNRENRGPIQL